MEREKTSNPIKFSIILTSYNLANYIEEAIESIINQTYPYWELIIIDDGSQDNSVEKIKPYLKDARIKLYVHEKNQGAGKTVRDAMRYSSNEIIGLIDSDDALAEDALEIMANAYKYYPHYGVIHSNYWICDKDLKIIKEYKYKDGTGQVNPKKSNLLEKKVKHFKTYRREAYEKTKGFNPKLKMNCDRDIVQKLEEVTEFKYIDKPLYYYRVHESGVTRSNPQQVFLESYITRVNAYFRRLNTELPNITLEDLYTFYYNITFYNLFNFIISAAKFLKISLVINRLKKSFPNSIQKILSHFKKNIYFSFLIKKFK